MNESVPAAPSLLRLEQLTPSRTNPRKRFEDAALKELADSLLQQGMIEPIVARPLAAGGYEIVAGERRGRKPRK